MDNSLKLFLRALVMSVLSRICMGQDSSLFPIEPKVVTVRANTLMSQPLFGCEFTNITDSFNLAWTLNGVVISSAKYVFRSEYREMFDPLGTGNHGTLTAKNLSLDFHGSIFTCRLYNSSVDLSRLTPASDVEPVYETSAGVLRISDKPSKVDPGCELALIPGREDSHRIEFGCCVTLTREELTVSLIQKTVVYGENVSDMVDDLSENRRQCFPHTVSESALNDGNFQCVLESRLYRLEQTCAFQSFKPSINLSRLEPKGADLTCDHDSSDIIGYSWSIDKDIRYTLSRDSRHCFINEELTHPSVLVSCTVFTTHGFGSAKLQLNIQQKVNPDPASWGTVILIGVCMGTIICFLFVFIIGYLIYKRGICFCFKPPERYTQNDLRRMQLERESIAQFHKLRQSHPHRGGGETVSFITTNGGGGHRYQPPVEEEEDVPPIPGGSEKFTSHLLDYADLDHGNTPPDVADDPSLPQRPDTSKVEYADILKPPTKSLRDMS